MGSGQNKVFLPLGDRPLLAHTLGVLAACPEVREVVVAVGEGEEDTCRREVIEPFGLEKATAVIRGGDSRQETVSLALDYIGSAAELIVVHDGARPLLPPALLLQAVRTGRDCGAVAPCLPVTDTLKRVDWAIPATASAGPPAGEAPASRAAGRRMWAAGTLDRSRVRRVQTPQVFWFDLLQMAYRRARDAGVRATDDASLVEHLRHRVWLIPGSPENIKITTPLDLLLARALLEARRSRGIGGAGGAAGREGEDSPC